MAKQTQTPTESANTLQAAVTAAEAAVAKAKTAMEAAKTDTAKAELKVAYKKAMKVLKKAKLAARPAVSVIPEWKDKDGVIVMTKLGRRDFPKSIAGKQAYCKYQADRWLERADNIGKAKDPIAKKLDKIAKLQKQVELLKAEKAKAAKAAEEAEKAAKAKK